MNRLVTPESSDTTTREPRTRARFPATATAVFAAGLFGCVSVVEDAGPWESAASITGELAPELGPVPEPIAAPSTLRVASWNVHFNDAPEALAANLLASELANVDVLLIQETEAWVDEPVSRTRRLAEALGMTWVYAPARVEDVDGETRGTHGIAVLSRFPFAEVAVRRLPYIEQPIRARRRNALAVDVVVGTHRVRVVDLHLDLRIGAADRILQLDPAVGGQPERMLIGGDFNTNPYAWVEATVPLAGTEAIVGMEQAVVVDDYLATRGFTPALPPEVSTFRVPGLGARIDNIYARGHAISAAGVAFVDGSDHWPIWVDVPLD